jgi:hypothetical protein
MITLTIAATLAVLAPLAWLLVETSRRGWLALAVPAIVAAPIAFFLYGQSLLGYAAPYRVPAEFQLVHASVDRDRVLLLIRTNDGTRLHSAPATDSARKQAGKAQAALEKGMAVAGRRSAGGADDNGGEFVLYELPPRARPKG